MKLGRYEVVRELGKGAMGIVYLAKDPLIGRLVALKTIRAAVHADDDEQKEFQQRFIREAQAAGILNHPSIVTVHDIGQDEGSAVSFIAMEYVEGQNLKEVLNQGRALSFEMIGDIIAQVGEALDFAHAKGIVHRDVKPANIILVDGTRAKITDFGIAKIASSAANLTTTGQFLGTPNYMAPEQVKGAPVDGRTDIFALGICLYECLTRRKPFGGDSLTSISYKIVHEPFPPLYEINPQIPEGFEEVVAHCLAKDPAKRYQRARDLAVALRAVIRGDRPSRPTEPLLADETMVTRERPQPTVEVPFPEALAASAGAATRPAAPHVSAAAAVAAASSAAASAPTLEKPKAPRQPIAKKLHTTLTNVRTLPMWRRHVAAPIFLAIVAVLVIGLLAGVVGMRMLQPDVPAVDTALEMRRARERQLRLDGDALLRQGRVNEAFAKYEELRRLAPKSPYVANLMQKLNAIRQQEELSKQQITQAQTKYQEGMTLFSEKKYPDAIVRFQEALAINPNFFDATTQMTLAQAEQQKLDAARLTRQQQRLTGRTVPTTTAIATRGETSAVTQTTAPAQPAQITTVFAHPFTDGNIIVRIGADIVASEPLFVERRRRVINTLVRQPRPISVSREFPAKNADVQVWITVPQLKIQEHHNIPAVRFEAGGSHRLIVRYNATAKSFAYELN
ncbi:MAG TPA: protein kinase [Thermoanaerobaculia bacterium]|nr:protein kinase [Thermoanaerobaculia bacterium]